MATVSDILTELIDISGLLAHNLQPATKDNLVKGLSSKITSIQVMDPTIARTILESVQASALGGSYKDILSSAVEQRLSSGFEKTSVKQSKDPQLMTNVCAFLTISDWQTIDGPRSAPGAIMSVICARLSALNIQSLHEQTVKASVTIIISIMKTRSQVWPSYHMIHDWVNGFKKEFQLHKRASDLPCVLKFPQDPSGIPQALYTAAYTEEDPPVVRSIPMFKAMSEMVPLRGNSALLQREMHMNPVFNQGMMPMQGKQVHMDMLMQGATNLPGFKMLHQSRGQAQPQPRMLLDHGYHAHSPQAMSAKAQSPESSPTARASGIEPPHQSMYDGGGHDMPKAVGPELSPGHLRTELAGGASKDSTEPLASVESAHDFEQSVFSALVARTKTRRKPAAAVGTDDSSAEDACKSLHPCRKRPASAAPLEGCVMKRPAGSLYTVRLTAADTKVTTLHNITSKHYSRARALAQKAGLPESKCKVHAKHAFHTAKDQWAKLVS